MMFHFMLTDRGIRRFKALPETERLIAMCRADIEARDGSYTYFNHNSKYLTRAETDELLLEPLLNGNEIMEYTSLPDPPWAPSAKPFSRRRSPERSPTAIPPSLSSRIMRQS